MKKLLLSIFTIASLSLHAQIYKKAEPHREYHVNPFVNSDFKTSINNDTMPALLFCTDTSSYAWMPGGYYEKEWYPSYEYHPIIAILGYIVWTNREPIYLDKYKDVLPSYFIIWNYKKLKKIN